MVNQTPQNVKPLQDPGIKFPLRYLTKFVIKTHYPLLAIHGWVAFACAGAGIMLLRALIFSPDVKFFKQDGKTAWDNLKPSYRFQLYKPSRDDYRRSKNTGRHGPEEK